MHRKCGPLVYCVTLLVLVGGLVLGQGTPTSLLVQQALREAQTCLERGEPGTAVRILERQLPHINGDAAYLDLLAQAYDQYLAELHRLSRTDLLPLYLERLAILNPARAANLRREWQISAGDPPATRVVARGRLDDEPFLQQPIQLESYPQLADQAFTKAQYSQARLYYWRAAKSRQPLSTLQQQRWAYCSWWEIYHLLQSEGATSCDWSVVLLEARAAAQLSNDWLFAQQLLQEVQRRQFQHPLAVRHLAQPHNGWHISESTHFRIYHHNTSLAEQVLRLAEHTHAVTAWFWFGDFVPPRWDSPCAIYLHPNAESFSRTTGVSPSVSGFSTLTYDRSGSYRVLSRRMDLRADAPDLLTRLVPHETTHISLAERFGPRPLPRWADEALALLAEPEEFRQIYRKKTLSAASQGRLLPLEQLLTCDEYPPGVDPHVFYGQSLILAEWLINRSGEWTLVHFIVEARRHGWEPALRRVYHLNSLNELAKIFDDHANMTLSSAIALPILFHKKSQPGSYHPAAAWNR